MREGENVDYQELAEEALQNMRALTMNMHLRTINESLQGRDFVLRYIASQSDEVIPSEISQEMGTSTARVAATLNDLEDKGFIQRSIDRSDRRRIRIKLTEDGQKHVIIHSKEILETMEKMLAYLGEEDAREYVRITGRLAKMPK